jgi:uncharacterized coiled-coil protein SlyX
LAYESKAKGLEAQNARLKATNQTLKGVVCSGLQSPRPSLKSTAECITTPQLEDLLDALLERIAALQEENTKLKRDNDTQMAGRSTLMATIEDLVDDKVRKARDADQVAFDDKLQKAQVALDDKLQKARDADQVALEDALEQRDVSHQADIDKLEDTLVSHQNDIDKLQEARDELDTRLANLESSITSRNYAHALDAALVHHVISGIVIPAECNFRSFKQAHDFIQRVARGGRGGQGLVGQAASLWKSSELQTLLQRCQDLLKPDAKLVDHIQLLKQQGNAVAHQVGHFTLHSLFEHYKAQPDQSTFHALSSLSKVAEEHQFRLTF